MQNVNQTNNPANKREKGAACGLRPNKIIPQTNMRKGVDFHHFTLFSSPLSPSPSLHLVPSSQPSLFEQDFSILFDFHRNHYQSPWQQQKITMPKQLHG